MSENGSEPESKGTLRFALFVALGLAVAILILSVVIDDLREDSVSVDAAMSWVGSWIGLLFDLLAPVVGIWMLRTKDLGWVVLLPVAFFLAGATLLGLGAWGPYVGLSAVVLAAAAIVIWRPTDDASS